MHRTLPVLFLAALVAVSALPAHADMDCGSAVPVTLIDTVDTAASLPGQRFRFKTTVPVKRGEAELPIGTEGVGLVRYVKAAETRNRTGLVVLEPRMLVAGETRIPVMADPREAAQYGAAATVADQALAWAPIGWAGTIINTARSGRNVKLGPGFSFHIIMLDDALAQNACVAVSPSPSPTPAP